MTPSMLAPTANENNPGVICRRMEESVAEWSVVTPNDIIYAFLESEITSGHIEAEWVKCVQLEYGLVYVRTAKGVFETPFEHLTDFEKWLCGLKFVDVNRSLIARLDNIKKFALPLKVGIPIRGVTEWLTASHRNFDKLLALFRVNRKLFRAREKGLQARCWSDPLRS